MVENAVIAIAGSVAVFAGGLLVLAAVFRAQVRRYHRTVALDLLNDWRAQLELLSAEDRDRAYRSPPPNVLAAMFTLPAPGLRSGWNSGPASTLDSMP
jgi:hypothetical protein